MFTGILATVMVGAIAMTACKGNRSAPACDQAAVERRQQWLDSSNRHRGDGKTHRELGFSASGNCSIAIEEMQLTCDPEQLKATLADNPFLSDALDAGFETYVCKTLDGDKAVRREFPLALLATRPDPARKQIDAIMARMVEFKDAMCRCRDSSCATSVSDEMTKWSQEQARRENGLPKMTKEDLEKASALSDEMGRCMHRAMSRK